MSKLHLGVCQKIITPKVGALLYGYRPNLVSTSVADDLTVSAFYFCQRETKALMLSITVGTINTNLDNEIRTMLSETFGINKDVIILSSTHTHSAPNLTGTSGWGDIDREYYNEILIPAILDCTKTAIQNTLPVKVGVGTGESDVGINRRETHADGQSVLGQNPLGSYNPKMTILTFKDYNENTVGTIIHYGCHGTCAGESTEISRDWSGFMTDAISKAGGEVTAFFNGCEGDVGPRLSNGKTVGFGNFEYVREIGKTASKDALKIFSSVNTFEDMSLSVNFKTAKIPLKPRIITGEAEAIFEEYQNKTTNHRALIRHYAETVLKANKENKPEEDYRCFRQTLIGIGNCVFVSFPYEPFSKIGIDIDNAFPKLNILCLSNTNGSEGYFITEDAIEEGGYEVTMFRYGHDQEYCKNADVALINETIDNIKEMEEQKCSE